jgi:hypothetical protein
MSSDNDPKAWSPGGQLCAICKAHPGAYQIRRRRDAKAWSLCMIDFLLMADEISRIMMRGGGFQPIEGAIDVVTKSYHH